MPLVCVACHPAGPPAALTPLAVLHRKWPPSQLAPAASEALARVKPAPLPPPPELKCRSISKKFSLRLKVCQSARPGNAAALPKATLSLELKERVLVAHSERPVRKPTYSAAKQSCCWQGLR